MLTKWHAILAMACTVAGTGVGRAATYDEFNGTTTAPWGVNGLANATESGGFWSADQSGTDPFMTRTAGQYFEGYLNPYVHIRMAVPSTFNTNPEIFWNTVGQGPAGGVEQHFTTINDGAFHNYVIDLSANAAWTGRSIGTLRLDPTDNQPVPASDATYQVDYIRVSNSPTNSAAFGGIDEFSNDSRVSYGRSNIITTADAVAGGVYTGTTITDNGDPHLDRDVPDFAGSDYAKVEVRLRNRSAGARSAEFFFTTEANGNFNGTFRKQVDFTSDGSNFNTFTFDFSADPNWVGHTITQVRLDPTISANDTFDIDYIRLVPEPSSLGLLALGVPALLRRRRRAAI